MDLSTQNDHLNSKLLDVLCSEPSRCWICDTIYWKCSICAKLDDNKSVVHKRADGDNVVFAGHIMNHIRKKHTINGDNTLKIRRDIITVIANELTYGDIYVLGFANISNDNPHLNLMHMSDPEISYDCQQLNTNCNNSKCINHSHNTDNLNIFSCRNMNGTLFPYLRLDAIEEPIDRSVVCVHGEIGSIVIPPDAAIQEIMNTMRQYKWGCALCGKEFETMPNFDIYYSHLRVSCG